MVKKKGNEPLTKEQASLFGTPVRAEKQNGEMTALAESRSEPEAALATPRSSPEPAEVRCPQCGGRALETVHPAWHGGKTHYCAARCGDYYFTPNDTKPGPTRLLKEAPHKPYFEEGGIILYHGDCREILLWLVPASVDCVITDPPYGIDYDSGPDGHAGKGSGKRNSDERLQGDDTPALYKSLGILRARCKPDCSLYIFYAWNKSVETIQAIEGGGFEIRNIIVWNKNRAPFTGAQYKCKSELILYCYLSGESPQWHGKANENNVWDYDIESVNEFHPTQKPVPLLKRAIKNSSKVGDLVLDPFCGSGSTLVAAKDLGRKAIGIEIEEKYCKIAANRLRQGVLL